MDIADFSSGIQERIRKVLQNEELKNLCLRERTREDFDDILSTSLKVASVDVSDIHENNLLISDINLFAPGQIKNDIIEFYTLLDNLDPNGINLVNRIKANSKYVRLKPKFLGERSYCFSGRDKNGNKLQEIFINLEGRIGDADTAIHEVCHSCCPQFMECVGPKDKRVGEIPAVITDHLSTNFLKKKYPQFAENFLESDKLGQKLNIKKARECVFDALFIKVMCGEVSLEEVLQKYGNMFNDFPSILLDKLRDVEMNAYKPFYEYSYLVPQAIALEMADRAKDQPKLVAKQLKGIIKDNNKLTEDQILDLLCLPQKNELLDNYVSKFQERIKKINEEQQFLTDNNPNPVA